MTMRISPRCSMLRTVPTSVMMPVNMRPLLTVSRVAFHHILTDSLDRQAPETRCLGEAADVEALDPRPAVAADHPGLGVPEDPGGGPRREECGRDLRAALHQQPGDTPRAKGVQGPREVKGTPARDPDHLHAPVGKCFFAAGL